MGKINDKLSAFGMKEIELKLQKTKENIASEKDNLCVKKAWFNIGRYLFFWTKEGTVNALEESFFRSFDPAKY